MNKIANRTGLILFGVSIIWLFFNFSAASLIFLRTPSFPISGIFGILLQPLILMTLSLFILYFTKIPNFMNDPLNPKKWILVTLISFYLCFSCAVGCLYNIYATKTGVPNPFYSFCFFSLFSSIIAFLIYLKRKIEIAFLNLVISVFSLMAFLFCLFVIYIYIFAQPDYHSRPEMALLVFMILILLTAFQVVQFKKGRL